MKKVKVLEELGRGGFGVVHRLQASNGEVYARKMLLSPNSLDLDSTNARFTRGRFRREVRIQRGISHPNVVPVIEANLDGATPWFTMPLASTTLERRIATDRRMGTVSFDPLWDVLAGLEALHLTGFVHRDLKPANVLLLPGAWACHHQYEVAQSHQAELRTWELSCEALRRPRADATLVSSPGGGVNRPGIGGDSPL